MTKESLVKAIAEALEKTGSLELDGNEWAYYLHIDEDGNIKVEGLNPQDEMISAVLGTTEDFPDIDDFYLNEDLDNPDFARVCDDLADQYLKRFSRAFEA